MASQQLATPAVLFCLWVVILRARMSKLWSEGGWCDIEGYYVSWFSSESSGILLILPTDVRILILDGNSVTSLEKGSFILRVVAELEELNAGQYELEWIELGTFSGLTKLRKLLMCGKVLGEIVLLTFQKISSPAYLDLWTNRLERLEVNVSSGLINLQYGVCGYVLSPTYFPMS